MNKIYKLGLLLLFTSFFSLVSITSIHADSTNPTPTKEFVVDDYVNLLSDKTKSVIIDKEKSYQQTNTKPQVVVMTIKSTNEQPIASYTGDLLRNERWHIGDKKNNNGVLILFAKNGGKNNIRINVGYGLEGVLPDITCHNILKTHEADLKSSDDARVEKGLIGVFSDVTTIVDKTTKTMPTKKNNTTAKIVILLFGFGLIILLAGVLYKISNRRNRDDSHDDNDDSHGGGLLASMFAFNTFDHTSDSDWGSSGWGGDSGFSDSGWGDSGFSDSGGGGSDGGGGADM